MAGPLRKAALVACAALCLQDCTGLRLEDKRSEPAPRNECLQKESLEGLINSTLASLARNRAGVVNPMLASSPLNLARVECPPVSFINPPRQRTDLGELLYERGYKGIGVEVGVQRGRFMRHLAKKWGRLPLYIQVDLWAHQANYNDTANVNDTAQADLKRVACSEATLTKKEQHLGEVVQCHDFSTECAKLIPDSSVDFVYIDARHDRKGVLEDLRAYWPKVRAGGVIAGHDYMTVTEVRHPGDHWEVNYDGTKDETLQAVRGAVNDFFSGSVEESPKDLKECPRQPVITYREMAYNTWIVAK